MKDSAAQVLQKVDRSRTRIHHGKAKASELGAGRALSFGGTMLVAGSLAKVITHYWPPPEAVHDDVIVLIVWLTQTLGFVTVYLWKKYFG